MAEVPYDPVEIAEVFFVSSFSDYTAPTTAEVNAGTRITQYLTDGPPNPAGSNFIDAGTLASGFQSQVASTYGGGSGTMTGQKIRDTATTDDTADDFFALFPRGTVGYLVVAPYGVSGTSNAAADGDTVTVLPVEVGNRGTTITRGQLAVTTVDVAFNGLPAENVDLTT